MGRNRGRVDVEKWESLLKCMTLPKKKKSLTIEPELMIKSNPVLYF